MKRYPEYKPFGNYWISKIPTHWKEQKIKHLFDERVEKGYPDEPLLAATQNRGVILKSDYESRTVEATKDLHLLKLVRVGDFVISLRSFQGGIEYSYCQGIISPAYTIMIPRSEIDSSYFRHLAKSRTFIELLKGCVTGIREGQNINYALLRTYLLPLPPIEEQKIIADYLDKKIEQIDRFISLQKEAISLLKELRQAEITKAVTKGLDENAEMKDNKITWLSDIPIYWGEKKIKYLFDERVEKGFPTEPLLVSTQSNGVILKSDYESRTVEAMKDLHLLKLVKVGDFVISLRSFQGGIEYSYCQGIISPAYTIMIPNEDIDSGYFKHLAKSSVFIELLKICVTGIREGQNINYEKLKTHYLPVPPMHEQKEIASYLNKKCAEIDSAIQNKEALIEKVTEYKTRLISDAVTGKIDVRGGRY